MIKKFLLSANIFIRTSISPEKVSCEGLITQEECFKAIKQMQHGKPPGTDGLPVEFYRILWNDISSLFVKSMNNAFRKVILSVTQRRGIISLIPKKDIVLYHLRNWRPISLLNCDYKIAAKVFFFFFNLCF